MSPVLPLGIMLLEASQLYKPSVSSQTVLSTPLVPGVFLSHTPLGWTNGQVTPA